MENMISPLRSRLDELRQELDGLQRQRQDIEARIAELSDLYEAVHTVLDHELKQEGLPESTQASWAVVRPKIPAMTLKDAIYTIVKMHGGENGIHVSKILEKLQEAGFAIKSATPEVSIASTIHINTKEHGTYEKVRPNTFKLAAAHAAALRGNSGHQDTQTEASTYV